MSQLNVYFTKIKKYNYYNSLEKEYKISKFNIINLIKIYKTQRIKLFMNNFINNYKKRKRPRRNIFISEIITKNIIKTNDNNNLRFFRINNKDDKYSTFSRIIRDYFRDKYIK